MSSEDTEVNLGIRFDVIESVYVVYHEDTDEWEVDGVKYSEVSTTVQAVFNTEGSAKLFAEKANEEYPDDHGFFVSEEAVVQ